MQRVDLNAETAAMGFSYRAAALIVQDGKLLVARHVDYDCYYTIGGGVLLHETSGEAAVREALEETGHLFEIDRLAFVNERFYMQRGRRRHELAFYYLMKPPVHLQIAEGAYTDQGRAETLHWLPIDGLSEVNLVPDFLKARLPKLGSAMEHVITRECE